METKYIPYYKNQCTKIENCLNGGNWVNNCETCSEGFIYKWNEILKTIEYDYCLPYTTHFCGAVNENGSCIHCKKGFSM